MALTDVHFGKFLTHLIVLFESLSKQLSEESPDIGAIFGQLNNDPVYRTLQDMHPPVPNCERMEELRKQTDRFEKAASQKVRNEAKPFISTIRHFLESHRHDWDENGYFIVPVRAELANGKHEPGLVYLRRYNASMEKTGGAALWNIDGLTLDGNLLQFNRNYFNEIANVLIGVLYFSDYQRPFADPVRLRSDHSYKLLFGCEITHGESHGGAMLALFAE